MRQIIIIIIIVINLSYVESRKNIIKNNVKNIKNYCTRYSYNIINKEENINNSTNCTLYFSRYHEISKYNNENFKKNCINNITSLNNFIIIRNNCINNNMNDFSYGIIISLLSWIIIPLCCFPSKK